MEPVKTFTLAGYTAKIYQDTDAESPRDWDNLGTMACFHRRYNLGDKDPGLDLEEIEAGLESGELIGLPLYLYDHGGISMRSGPFSCPWDSGQVGYIYVKKSRAIVEYSAHRMTAKLRAKVLEVLDGEVQTYNEFLTGEVYGYVVEGPDDEHKDSCWGFFGAEYAEAEARAALSSAVEHGEKVPAAA